jgi:hypothetical protein
LGLIVPKAKREGRQDRKKSAFPRANLIPSEIRPGGNRTRGLALTRLTRLAN